LRSARFIGTRHSLHARFLRHLLSSEGINGIRLEKNVKRRSVCTCIYANYVYIFHRKTSTVPLFLMFSSITSGYKLHNEKAREESHSQTLEYNTQRLKCRRRRLNSACYALNCAKNTPNRKSIVFSALKFYFALF
jgi:hypothetical protein